MKTLSNSGATHLYFYEQDQLNFAGVTPDQSQSESDQCFFVEIGLAWVSWMAWMSRVDLFFFDWKCDRRVRWAPPGIWEISPKCVVHIVVHIVYPPPGFLWDLGEQKLKFRLKKAIFRVIFFRGLDLDGNQLPHPPTFGRNIPQKILPWKLSTDLLFWKVLRNVMTTFHRIQI